MDVARTTLTLDKPTKEAAAIKTPVAPPSTTRPCNRMFSARLPTDPSTRTPIIPVGTMIIPFLMVRFCQGAAEAVVTLPASV